MTNAQEVLFEIRDGVARITLNRPEKLNALNYAMVETITRHVYDSGRNREVRVIVISGNGRAFCSGDDIVQGMGDYTWGEERFALNTNRGPHYELIKTIMSAPKPVVAAINGRCHGAGWVTALACDFRVGRSDVLMGDIRSEKAIFANQGAGLLLPRLIGGSRAMDLLMTGRVIDATEAERFGLIARLWPVEAFETELAAFVGDLARGPTRTFAAWKLSVNRPVLMELDASTDYERWLDIGVWRTDDLKEGVRAFAEKRPPRFLGR
jgi:enoyl-CoA hydratase/carnithine racemase